MFDLNHEDLEGEVIKILDPYKPWNYHKECGGDSSNYPLHSGKILDIKFNRPEGIRYFTKLLKLNRQSGWIIATVPGHDPEKIESGIRALGQSLAKEYEVEDGTGILRRIKKIEKLSQGGDRSVQVHLQSVMVNTPDYIRGRSILLIDDVMTTGNSLIACRKLLLDAGAERVQCLALGRTTY